MFTADKARDIRNRSFDSELEKLVREAHPHTRAYYRVHWDEHGSRMHAHARAQEVADWLRLRGFTVLGTKDLDSYRFAEVHFSWEATTDGTDAR